MNRYQVTSQKLDNAKRLTSKVFVSTSFDVDEAALQEVADRVGASGIHTHRGAYPELDQEWDRQNRVLINHMREAAKQALCDEGVEFKTLHFSKHAGCSMCPCSPGFIMKGGPKGYDIWVGEVRDEPRI